MARYAGIRFTVALTVLALVQPAAVASAQEAGPDAETHATGTPGIGGQRPALAPDAPVVRFLVPAGPEPAPAEVPQIQEPAGTPDGTPAPGAAAQPAAEAAPETRPITEELPMPSGELPRLQMISATSQFMEQYYRSPQPEQALALLEVLDVPAFIATDSELGESHGIAVLTAFFAHVLRDNPDLIPALAQEITAAADPLNVLIGALSIATAAAPSSPESLAAIARSGRLPPAILDEILATEPFPFPHLDPRSHLDLDLLWASFYASGDTGYVERIVETLQFSDAEYARSLPRDAEGTARLVQQVVLLESVMAITARWTLVANAKRHPRVMETLRRVQAERDDRVGTIVASIVAEVEGE